MVVFEQLVINAVVTSSIIALGAIGITMVFSLLKFANAAHGSLFTLGAYFTFAFSVILGLNFVISVVLAMIMVALIACLCEKLVFERLRKFGGLTVLISSIALVFIFDNGVRLFFGVSPKTYNEILMQIYTIGGGQITLCQILIVITTLSAMFLFHFLLTRTKTGKAMRALSDNPDLAESCGINVGRIILLVWVICGSFAALGGMWLGMDTQLRPMMGWELILPLFAAAIVGGIGNPYGAVLGSVVIGFSQTFILAINWGGIFTLGAISYYLPTIYKTAISFFLIIIFLIFRPRGIMRGKTGD